MPSRRQSEPSGTRSAILDAAERMVQTRGFNGFSFADVAAELKITTAALHYHFAGKAALGGALIERYSARFGEALDGIAAMDGPAPAKLRAYADLYLGVLREQRMCLCGMLAAEYQTLPDPMRTSVVSFLDQNCEWLSALLEAGRSERSLHFDGTAPAAARMIVGALEGAMLVSRPYADTEHFELIANRLIDDLTRPARPARARR
ncbi:MAG TPA: TetR/AcrR family transcriptional regulator [Acidimicrobiales bacterium]|nr:TetR/AcrR family transcriptional regulator [Acidimicrobiales bacterium]